MKRATVFAVAEAAYKRAVQNLLVAHPDAIDPHFVRSLEKRLTGLLYAELLRKMGHPPEPKPAAIK